MTQFSLVSRNSNMYNLKDEKNILSQIVKARDAIKKKYKLLQSNKTGFEKVMGETFKPITEPLEKLVNINEKQQKNLNQNENIINNEDNGSNSSLDTRSFNTAGDEDEIQETEELTDEEKDFSSLYEKYLNLSSRLRDNVYGVREEQDGTLKIGDSPITFAKHYIDVQEVKYPTTDGLLELLFKSQPDANHVASDDIKNYRKIVEMTNAFRKDYKEVNPIHRSRSNKYKYYIAPFFDKSLSKRKIEGTGVSLPQYKLARKNTRMDYVYWDDPNELVDRLRLLLAEMSAGNQSHTNEIHSIIEELREAGYVH